jgi:hypothetical protein
MSENSKYDEFLIEESKNGRNNSFINLCLIYVNKIFPIVFMLVPIWEVAIKISAETLVVLWRNIKKVDSSSDLIKLIEKTAVLRCLDYSSNNSITPFDNKAITELTNEINSTISSLEKEVLGLSNVERVLIILCDRVGLSVETVDEIYSEIEYEEIVEKLNSTRKKLIGNIPNGKFSDLTEVQWNTIKIHLKNSEEGKEEELNDDQNLIVDEYLNYVKEVINGLFKSIVPDEEIIKILRNYLIEEDTKNKQKQKSSVDNEEIQKIEKLLNKNFGTENNKPGGNEKSVQTDSNSFPKKRFLKSIITFGIILIVFGGLFNLFNKLDPWKISEDFVIAIVNGKNATTEELKEGDIISTANGRKTKITLENFASIELLENSEFLLGSSLGWNNKFELKFGAMNFNSAMGEEDKFYDKINYTISSPHSTIETINSKFNYSTNELKGFRLLVNKGWLSIQFKNDTVYMGINYVLKYDNTQSLIIPYHKNSSIELINAINQITQVPTSDDDFKYIINNVEEKDALVLWHLLSLSDFYKRKIVLEKLDELLLLELIQEANDKGLLSDLENKNLLNFIISDLLMRGDE